jgi:F-type H+-transporting ATPase subunit b
VLEFSVTFFITIVNVTFLYFVLRKVLFKPVTQFMEARQKSIQTDIDLAKRAKERADVLEAEYTAKIANANEECRALLQSARVQADRVRDEIIAQAHADAEKILAAARQNIEEEKRSAERVLRQEAADISILAASRLVEQNLDSGKNRELVRKFIESVEVA